MTKAAVALTLIIGNIHAFASVHHNPSPILVIGDSHTVGAYGQELDRLLRTLPDTQVASYGVWGSSPNSWLTGLQIQHAGFFNPVTSFFHFLNGQIESGVGGAGTRTPLIQNLLHEIHPRLTLVGLGANDLRNNTSIDVAMTRALRIAISIAEQDSLCIWVGPPNGRNKSQESLEEYYQALRDTVEVAGTCDVVDSRPYTRYPRFGGDGAHFNSFLPGGERIAHRWATAVFEQIKNKIRDGGIR